MTTLIATALLLIQAEGPIQLPTDPQQLWDGAVQACKADRASKRCQAYREEMHKRVEDQIRHQQLMWEREQIAIGKCQRA